MSFFFSVVEPAIKQAGQLAEETRAAAIAARPDSPPSKRKSSRLEEQNEEEEVHNTRFKGTKRVKLSKDESESVDSFKPTPKRGRPRKSATEAPASETDAPATASTTVKKRGRPRKNPEDGGSASVATKPKAKKAEKATNAASDGAKRARGRPRKSLVEEDGKEKKEERKKERDGEEKPKRGRGRPRKSVNNEPTSSAPPSKSGKPVFDGVLLKKRKSDQHEGSVNGDADADADADAEGVDEDINEVQAVLAAPNGPTNEDSPSQTESNKGSIFLERFFYRFEV